VERQLELSLIERVRTHLRDRTTDQGEEGRAPVAHYRDPARLQRERDGLFKRLPVAIGHGCMAPAPGDFFTHDALGVPILAVRGDDGTLRAFLNVCRHRGTQVARGAGKACRAFVCPYHGWTYDRAGALVGVPHKAGFRRTPPGLVPLPTAELAGLVFINADPEPYLGPLAADLTSFGLQSHHIFSRRRETRPLNWKIGIEIFLETYHLKRTHEETIYPLFFDNLGLVDRVGPHLRNIFPKRTIRALVDDNREAWSLRAHANVLYHLFPNTLVLMQPDHASVLHLFPQTVDTTIIESYTLVPEAPRSDKAREYWSANNEILYGATDEDFERGESIQRGLSSAANEHFSFATYEHALTHFHAQIEACSGA
jgi:phenylpropionate dioxygenase-like ring-hydroxylating dioxygenase large terminal subunit